MVVFRYVLGDRGRPVAARRVGRGADPGAVGLAFVRRGCGVGAVWGTIRTRGERITGFADALEKMLEAPEATDWTLVENLLDRVGEVADPAILDQVQALAKAPGAAVFLLFRATQETLAERLTLEDHSPFAWITTPVEAWVRAMGAERERLVGLLQLAGAFTPDQARALAADQLAARVREIARARPELAGHLAFGLIRAGLPQKLIDCPNIVPNPRPEFALYWLANDVITRQGGAEQSFRDLAAKHRLRQFAEFNPALRGLVEAPLVAAELALGQRDDWRDSRIALALLHFRHLDPHYFETALPVAIAFLSQPEVNHA